MGEEAEGFTSELMAAAKEAFSDLLRRHHGIDDVGGEFTRGQGNMSDGFYVDLTCSDVIDPSHPPLGNRFTVGARVWFLDAPLPSKDGDFINEGEIPQPMVFGVSSERWSGMRFSWEIPESVSVRFRVKWKLEYIGAPDDPVKTPFAAGVRVSLVPEAAASFRKTIDRAKEQVLAFREEALMSVAKQ